MEFYSIKEPETGDLVVIQGDPQTAHPLTMVLTAEGIREMTAKRIEHPLYVDWIRFLTGYQDKLDSLTSLLSQDAYISSLYTKLTSSMAVSQEELVVPAVVEQKSEADAEGISTESCEASEQAGEEVSTDESVIEVGEEQESVEEPTIEEKLESVEEPTIEEHEQEPSAEQKEDAMEHDESRGTESANDLQKICDIGRGVVKFFCETMCNDSLKFYCQTCNKTVKQWVEDYLTSVEHSSHIDELQALLEPLQWGSSTVVSSEEADEVHALLLEMMEEAKYSGSREELERIVDPIYYLVCSED